MTEQALHQQINHTADNAHLLTENHMILGKLHPRSRWCLQYNPTCINGNGQQPNAR